MSPPGGRKPEAAGCKITKADSNLVVGSIVCSIAYGLYGSCYTALAAAIPQLAITLHVDSSDFGMAYTTRGVGYLVGTLISARILKIPNLSLSKTLMTCLSLLFTAMTMFLLSFSTNYSVVVVIFAVQGIGFGGIDMFANCALPELWDTRAQPWMQGMHTMFGISSIVGPFLVGYIGYKIAFIIIAFMALTPIGLYFLGIVAGASLQQQQQAHQRLSSNEESVANDSTSIEMVSVHGGTSAVLTLSDEDEIRFDDEESQTNNTSTNNIPTPVRNPISDGGEEVTSSNDASKNKIPMPNIIKYLTCGFYFLYMGYSAGFASWVTVFALDIGVTDSNADAAYLTSVFWVAMTLGRLIAIFVAIYLSSTAMMRMQLAQCLIFAILFVFLSSISYNSLLVGSFLFGYAGSSLFPLGMTVLTDYGYAMDPGATTLFMVGTTLGDAILPAVVGYSMMYGGAITFPYIILSCCILLIVFYLIVDHVGKNAALTHTPLDQSMHSNAGDSGEESKTTDKFRDRNDSPTGIGGINFSPIKGIEHEENDVDDLVQIEL